MIIYVHSYKFDLEEFKAYFNWWMSLYGHLSPDDTSDDIANDFIELKEAALETGLPKEALFKRKNKNDSI